MCLAALKIIPSQAPRSIGTLVVSFVRRSSMPLPPRREPPTPLPTTAHVVCQLDALGREERVYVCYKSFRLEEAAMVRSGEPESWAWGALDELGNVSDRQLAF